MPYKKFTKKVIRVKKFCVQNKITKKVTCFGSEAKRATGIRLRHAFAHGWKPSGKQKTR